MKLRILFFMVVVRLAVTYFSVFVIIAHEHNHVYIIFIVHLMRQKEHIFVSTCSSTIVRLGDVAC